eukprot:jgi/Tetstr1/421673/TSEL_012612.t1
MLFGDLVVQHHAMDEESRSRTVLNLVRTSAPRSEFKSYQAEAAAASPACSDHRTSTTSSDRIVIYLTEAGLDPSELHVYSVSQSAREAGEVGGNAGMNQLRSKALSLRKKARKNPPASLALRADESVVVVQPTGPLELNYEENKTTMDVDDTGTHCGAAEVLDLADVTLDFPQRSLSRRTFREGTPDGTIERLPNIRNLATETADLLELSSQPDFTPYLARARNHAEAIDKAFRFRLACLRRLNEVKRVHAPKQPQLLGWRQQLQVANVDEDVAVDAGVAAKVSTSDGVGRLSSELLELCDATFQ